MSLGKYFITGVLLALLVCLSSTALAMPQIMGDVETDFAVYSPYFVDAVPGMPQYYLGDKLAYVNNLGNFKLTDKDKALLMKNAFVAKPSQFKQVYDVYKYCQESDIPIFVTTDSMLHVYHVLFDYLLRILEMREFYDDLHGLNEAMLAHALQQYAIAADPLAKTTALKNVAYFTVSSVLLDPSISVHPDVSGVVAGELALIDAHVGKDRSPIFGYNEDYSQYNPRGHYTRNETLKKYFRSMMWYGRMAFRLSPQEGQEKAREETLQALMIVAAINDANVRGEAATDVWNRIYEPTVFFVGKTDDLNVYEYTDLMAEIYDADPASLSPDELVNVEKLDEFIEDAREFRNPMINSSFVFEGEDPEVVTKGFRFMGQRFIPDSYMFQQLVHNKVLDRYFPKGLDVLAVLGSDRAYEILVDVYNEDAYPKYVEQIEKLRSEFGSMDEEMWAQNLYWNWLYVLMAMLEPKGEGYPIFMQNQAWVDKDLSTALGSWAELRHDTILYAKQSYAIETSIPMGPKLVKGYVEPNAELYARLASLTKFTRDGLSNRGLLLPEFDSRLNQLEQLLVSLKEISEIELEFNPISSKAPSRTLTSEQYGIILNIGKTLEEITTFPPEIASDIEGEEDKEMPVIADVHTDPNSAQVLEEGVGYPYSIFVVVPLEEGGLRIAQGAIFSYYEFKWPMANRLTDGEWQEKLKTNPPELPVWMNSFIDLAQSSATGEHYSFEQGMVWQPTEVEVSVDPKIVDIGVEIKVTATIYGTPNSDPTITLKQDSTVVAGQIKGKEDMFMMVKYAATLRTDGLKPGTAEITVSGRVGEENIAHTEEIILTGASAVDSADGSSSTSDNSRPLKNQLYRSYPNPFNPDVWIPYELNKGGRVTIDIYNTVGQLIRRLDLGYKFPDRYVDASKAAHWDGRNSNGERVSSGLYFYQLKAGDFVAMGKMIAIK